MRSIRLLPLVLVALLLTPALATAKPSNDVNVQLLGLNDFHGNLERHRRDDRARPRLAARTGRRRRVPRHPRPQLEAAASRNTPGRVGGRPDRRQPAAVGAVPRRADDRGDEPDRPRPERGRQPRVRRGRRRAAAHAARRVPPGRRLPRRRPTSTARDFRVPRGQRRACGHRQDAVPAVRDPAVRRASRSPSSA